jgi:4-carboxymuconolactone decarboxylase
MDKRYEQGRELLGAVAGSHAERLIDGLDSIAPGYSESLIAFAFGEICRRPGLELTTRELTTIAALAAIGSANPQLKLHIGGALRVGCTPTEIVEVLVQIGLYAGIPATLNGLAAAGEVFREQHGHDAAP